MKRSSYHSLLALTRTLCAILALALIAAAEVEAQEPTLYGIQRLDAGGFQLVRVDLDTGETDTLHSGLRMESLAIDVEGDKIYWADMGEILRSNLRGSDVETILDQATFEALSNYPMNSDCDYNLALDLTGKKIYSVGEGVWFCGPHSLRSNLDGSEPEWLESMQGLAVEVDSESRKVYWAGWTPGNPVRWFIKRANPDGSGQEMVTDPKRQIVHLGINHQAGNIYWMTPAGIVRAALDGSNAESIISFTNHYGCFELDETERKIYYTAGWSKPNGLFRSDLDGSNTETVLEGMQLIAFVLDVEAGLGSSREKDLPRPYTYVTLYPNPFSQSTKASYTLTKPVHVEARVIDMLGREVITLGSGFQLAGTHEFTIDGARLPSGIYLLQIQAGGFLETRSLVLTK